jgi:Cof subfamily protein (haloacid dehalogenase superfamily)
MKIVAIDLDGTLLPHGGKVSNRDLDTLRMLGNRGVVRVLATGRSFYAILRNIPRTFPIDYLIFSTGVGVMDWRTGEIIFSAQLSSSRVEHLVKELTRHRLDFMLHKPVPDTHHFYYSATEHPISDFHERMRHYPDYCFPLREDEYPESCQALAFIEPDMERYERIAASLSGFKVIRTTSPINGENMWIEVFDQNVSKGHALELLAGRLKVSRGDVMVVGNDFNDVDMLDFTPHSYVVANAPEQLRRQHQLVADATSSGFSEAVAHFFSQK